jgi:RNA polymerase sigma-70 factor (ECF subfamily)
MKEPGGSKIKMTKAALNPADEELAARAASGSRTAFEDLVSRYSLRLFHFLRSRSQSDEDVEDLVQETFLRVFQNIGRFDPQQRFSTWLYTIAIRLTISRHRSRRERPLPLELEGLEHTAPGPQESLARKEEAEEAGNIWLIARTMKPSEYQVLWLRYAEEMGIKEIARTMARSPVGVRVLLHRSRTKLGKKLREPLPAAGLAGVAAVGQRLSIP